MKKLWTADFETTTVEEDCRVWCWAICSIDNPDFWVSGLTISDFFDYLLTLPNNSKLFFHNLKFDGQFIVDYLLNHNFIWVKDKSEKEPYTFTTLITDMGLWYVIDVWFPNDKIKKLHHIRFQDSMKLLNFSVHDIAINFHLPILKDEIDYEKPRPLGYQPDETELEYIYHDVAIMAKALAFLFETGLNKMTIGANALSNYQSLLPNFQKWFPVLPTDIDTDIRKSYRGGWSYLNPAYKGKIVGPGLTLDRNSMYPSVMHEKIMPFGEPEFYEGEYKFDKFFPLFIQTFSCKFSLKPNKFPSVQIKNSPSFVTNEWLENSGGDIVSLTLCKPDFDLFMENYNIEFYNPAGGWKFQAVKGIFSNYIDFWINKKIKDKENNNHASYLIDKLMLNSLYGKFGTNPISSTKQPCLDENGNVSYRLLDPEEKDPIYIPIASFITSYARTTMISIAQAIRDYSMQKYGFDAFVYADTDSAHALLSKDDLSYLSKFIEIHPTKLGAWDLETTWSKAKFLRQKCYIEDTNEKGLLPHIAGLPSDLAKFIKFDEFDYGWTSATLPSDILKAHPKLTYKKVKGGVILVPTDFTIK